MVRRLDDDAVPPASAGPTCEQAVLSGDGNGVIGQITPARA